MRKTRRASKKGAVYPPMNIPELRRAFEHMEGWVLENHKGGPADFQEEWQKTFRKPVDRASAEAYMEHVLSENQHATKGKKGSQKHKQYKQSGGMAAPLAGAPLDYTTRPGLYITPGVNQGSYAQVPSYVQSGFFNPEVAQLYDPVPGQTVYPTRTPLGMGSNLVGGSRKKSKRRPKQGGGSLMSSALDSIHQLMFRPIPAMTPPPSVLMDAQSGMRGQTLGQSPDASQTRLQYRMSPMPQTVVGALPISAININRSSL